MKRRFSDEQIIGMIKEYEAGVKAQELCRKYGISDATFKYAGSVYKDIEKIKSGEDTDKALRNYVKYWGELKGFSMALQSGKSNLGATAIDLNWLIGFGPAMPDGKMVSDIDADGNFVRDREMSLEDYQVNMLKVQKLLIDTFGIESRAKDATTGLAVLADKLGTNESAENNRFSFVV